MAKINILFIVVKFNLNLFKNQKANKKTWLLCWKINWLVFVCLGFASKLVAVRLWSLLCLEGKLKFLGTLGFAPLIIRLYEEGTNLERKRFKRFKCAFWCVKII